MPITHRVQQGDYLPKIAEKYGFYQTETIWSTSENAELKQLRENPNVLLPGDRIVVPDKQEKTESGATEQRHRFLLKTRPLILRIVLHDINDQPIADTECKLIIDGTAYDLTTDVDGKIEQEIVPTAEKGTLTILDNEIEVLIGHLDPVEEPSGQRGRLNNLGYNAGSDNCPEDVDFKAAIEEFQCDHRLTVDGICGPQTQTKLKEIHGC